MKSNWLITLRVEAACLREVLKVMSVRELEELHDRVRGRNPPLARPILDLLREAIESRTPS